MRSLSADAVASGHVLLANSIPVATIVEALNHVRHCTTISRRCLRRTSETEKSSGRRRSTVSTSCRLRNSTGFCLGPTLLNIGFDCLLWAAPELSVICYADDTLITARGKSFDEAACMVPVGSAIVVNRIGVLGLGVSVPKSEALLFHAPRRAPQRCADRRRGDRSGRWGPGEVSGSDPRRPIEFWSAFRTAHSKARKCHRCVGKTTRRHNVGGPDSSCRRYASVVRHMALYRAPIWVDALTAHNKTLLRQPYRIIALRAICTVS
ncbi:unnamed protein product [Euphydryas editha]|uniref:Reverse transcriptase n=1 Tax=Euphydryas editha TaxID=104508 RepID=A0AAU9T9W3_EUPED|nr:unnamed protein product [Euphydryas editha]